MKRPINRISLTLFTFISLIFSFFTLADEPRRGQMAPEFEIKQLNGETIRLSDYKGKKPVYLIFWNTWCGYCVKKIPALKKTQALFSNKIKIIAINTSLNDSFQKIVTFHSKYELNYSVAFDSGKKITDRYNVWGTPTEFIVDINGVILYRDNIPSNIKNYIARWSQLSGSKKVITSQYRNCNQGVAAC